MLNGPGQDIACNPLPGFLAYVARRWPGFTRRYLALDPRSLGLGRIYLGVLLLADLLRRAPQLSVWFTDEGLLPSRLLSEHPASEYQFSLFFWATTRAEAVALFIVSGAAFFALAIGYRTRLFQLLSLICICSLHSRLLPFEDGSEVTTHLLAFWTVFLPLGARFSVDAVLRGARPKEQRPAISLAVLALLLQVALIYFFNALHKSGETWRAGTAVHYVLHQDRIVTWLGYVVRQHLTLPWSRVLTYGSLVVEWLLPALILTPLFTGPARRLALLLALGLHAGFALLLNLGMFSFNMVGFFLLLPGERDWAWLERTRLPAVAALRRAGAAVGAQLSSWFARGGTTDAAGEPAARPRIARLAGIPYAREATVLMFAVALGSQMAFENRGLPRAMRVRRMPEPFRPMVESPRFLEGWSMFAPEAPTRDLFVYADARTIDGRRIDPFNEAASRVARVPLHRIPDFLDQNDSFCDYSLAIAGFEAAYPALRRWIFDYPKRTGRANDAIESVDVWVLEDDSPEPGETAPRNTTRRRLLHAERDGS